MKAFNVNKVLLIWYAEMCSFNTCFYGEVRHSHPYSLRLRPQTIKLMIQLEATWSNGLLDKRNTHWLFGLMPPYRCKKIVAILVLENNHQSINGSHQTHYMLPVWEDQLTNTLQWRHDEHDGVSNHQPHDCSLTCLFRRRSKKASKLHVTGLCVGNSPVTGEFPVQRASNADNVSIWWRHHA